MDSATFLERVKGDIDVVRTRGKKMRSAISVQHNEVSSQTDFVNKKRSKKMAKETKELKALKARLEASEAARKSCEKALKKEEEGSGWSTAFKVGVGVAIGVAAVKGFEWIRDEWDNPDVYVVEASKAGFDL